MSEIFVNYVCSFDVRKKAWMMSRPYQKEIDCIDWDKILKMDMSLQSLNPICLHFKSSMAFRELITTLRDHSVWAQTSRVNPISQMQIPDYATEIGLDYDDLVNEILSLGLLPTEQQDDFRQNLRMCTLTEYFATLDIRSWIRFCKYLFEYQTEYFKIYGIPILGELLVSLEEFFKYSYTSSLIPGNLDYEDQLIAIGDYYFISTEISFSLRAQLVRHKYIQITDELPFMHISMLEGSKLCDKERVNLIMKKCDYAELARKRSCWIAQFSLYCDLLKPWFTDHNLIETIPCNGCKDKCAYSGDMQGRLEGKDPGLVCPLWLEKDQRENQLTIYSDLFGSNNILFEYRDMIYREDQ